jgi:hypothetical protein
VPYDVATRYDGPSLFPDATQGVSYDVEATAMTEASTDATPDARVGAGFRVVGTAVAQAQIDGVFLDEVIIERQL